MNSNHNNLNLGFAKIIVIFVIAFLLFVAGYTAEYYLIDFTFSLNRLLVTRVDFNAIKHPFHSALFDQKLHTLIISIFTIIALTSVGIWLVFKDKIVVKFAIIIVSIAAFFLILLYGIFLTTHIERFNLIFQSLKQWILSPFLFLMIIPVFKFFNKKNG